MTTPRPALPPISDDELIRAMTGLAVAFSAALVVVLGLGVLIAPQRTVSLVGLGIGVALGLWSWFGSRWITAGTLARAADRGVAREDVHGIVRTTGFMGLAFAEVPGLLALVLAVSFDTGIGPLLVAVPVSIAAIVVNAVGPPAVRRALERLRG